MSEPEAVAVSMAPLVASLSNSFHQLPPSAVPPLLDCILLSTGSSPHLLFTSLLHLFPPILQDIAKEVDNLDSDKVLHLQSLLATFCHLLKKIGDDSDALQSFIWRCFLPLAKALQASQHGLLNQITESFMNVVIETRTWEVLKATFVPIFLRSIGLSMGMLYNGDLDFYEWSSKSFCQGSYDVATDSLTEEELVLSSSSSFTLPTSCSVLCVTLEVALQFLQTDTIYKSAEENGFFADKFVKTLIWELCNMIERMLLHSSEHRSCGAGILLPIVLKAFPAKSSFEVSIRGQKHVFSREHFFIKMWNCCRTLFSTGHLERREAYNVLSLYFSFPWSTEECKDAVEEFDIRAEKEFWDEIRTGLVDKESLVRKQSLHILKMALNIQEGTNSMSSILKQDTEGKHSVPHGMTKREQWANKEAKSLGVGKISTSDDLIFNSQQYWGAFVLLYEMLEEYGTHLVEAAWNHQVSLLLQFSGSYLSVRSKISKVHQNQFGIRGETFSWLSILWEQGLHHDNPQVRCLIMQSFLDINWDNYGKYIKSVPETFVLGPFLQGLNDPIHHKEFEKKMIPIENYGIKCMSIGFLVEKDAPIVWRGPMVSNALEKMTRGVEWGNLDILVMDMPPGTGDVQIAMSQKLQLSGALIVSTPQDVALMDARRGVKMFNKVDVPILGIVENMSCFKCPRCGEPSYIFGEGGTRRTAVEMELEFLGEIPLEVGIRESCDHGHPIVLAAPDSVVSKAYGDVAERIVQKLKEQRSPPEMKL